MSFEIKFSDMSSNEKIVVGRELLEETANVKVKKALFGGRIY